MNILQIGTIDNRGGAARVSYGLKTKLEQLGHTSNMFVSKKYSNDPHVHVIKTPFYKKIICRFMGTDIDFWKTDFILKTEEFKKADLVHCHNLHGYYFNLKTLQKMSQQKPLIWTLHDMWAITPYCHHIFFFFVLGDMVHRAMKILGQSLFQNMGKIHLLRLH